MGTITAFFFICQVRVRIIEGRQLAGANISPVVRVNIDNQTRQTKVIKSTNKPFYDEVSGQDSGQVLGFYWVCHD